MKIKAWITRNSATAIQFGGLERVYVHFSKPKFFLQKLEDKDRDIPWGSIPTSEGMYRKYGWYELDAKYAIHKLSVGSWLGYEGEVPQYIWSKICDHFLNEPFDTWDELEKQGKCKVQDFLLEIELNIGL